MKYLITLLLIISTCFAYGQEIDYIIVPSKKAKAATPPVPFDICIPASAHLTIDQSAAIEMGTDKVRRLRQFFIDGYASINIDMSVMVEYLPTQTYSGTVREILNVFIQTEKKADVNLLFVSGAPRGGGVAYYDQWDGPVPFGVCNVTSNITDWPNYSFSSLVVNHEAGHIMGALHTHSCTWGEDSNQAIDNYVGVEGLCETPQSTETGTCMSYAHLRGLGGPLFNREVADTIRAKAYAANGACQAVCEENEIAINLTLDAYPDETSWVLTNFDGDTILTRGPFPRYDSSGSPMAGEVVGDTICLPDGCYTFEIFDINGLLSEVCEQGAYEIIGPNGLQIMGADFKVSERKRFCFNAVPPDNDCDQFPLTKDSLVDYANQSRNGQSYQLAEGVEIDGNYWQAQGAGYVVTESTVANVSVWVDTPGEINGIGFVRSLSQLRPGLSFRFAGSQRWGIPIEQVPVARWVDITIPIGQYLPHESISYAVLINDNDATGHVRTAWKNLELCESDAPTFNKSLAEPQGKASDENWKDTEADMQEDIKRRVKKIRATPYPVPSTSMVNLPHKFKWTITDTKGCVVLSGKGSKANISSLPNGMYFVKQGEKNYRIIKN